MEGAAERRLDASATAKGAAEAGRVGPGALLRRPAGVALLYAVLGALWIFATDHALEWLVRGPAALTDLQTAKGLLFILVTGLSLFLLIRSAARRLARSERALAASERRHDLLVRSVTEYALFMLDPEGRVVSWNGGAERIEGYAAEEILGRHFSAFYPPEDAAAGKPAAMLARAAAEGVARDEGWRLRKDGTRFFADVLLTAVHDEAGRLVGFAKVTRDMTQRREAAAALEESQAQHRRVERMAQVGHWVWRPDPQDGDWRGGLSHYSEAAAAIFGVAPAGLAIGNAAFLERFVHPEDRARAARAFESMQAAGAAGYTLEYRIRRADGQYRTVREVAENVRDETGRTVMTRGTVQDVTELRQAEAALIRRERLWRTVVETALDALIVMDDAGRIVEWNPQAERIFGWTRAEALGRRVSETIVPEADRPRHEAGLARVVATGESRLAGRRIEMTALRRDGTTFPVELAVAVTEVEGVRLFTGTLRDLTQAKAAEAQLRHAQKMEAIGQLTGGIAHDFNNLLSVMLGNSEMLLERLDKGDAAAQTQARGIYQAALRGAALTQRLLAFARKQPIDAAATDLNALVRGMEPLLARTLGEAVELKLALAPDLWPALVDGPQLEAAILNLAVNARDAMPKGGRLTIRTENAVLDPEYAESRGELKAGDYAMVAGADTGTGIPPELRERAFEPFFTTKEVGKGTGLGLPMVYGFAKQSGGHVALYSEVGIGTVVKLFLPRAWSGVEAAAVPAAARAPAASGRRILVVEDDPEVRATILRMLASLGHRAAEAADGPSALAALRRDGADLVLTDMVMPGGLTGWDLAQQIWAERPGMPVLLATGYTDESLLREASDPRLTLLQKPFSKQALDRAIGERLSGTGRQEEGA